MFDYIVVGGGSAGAVLANRLSARSANRVLLCEAGENISFPRVHPRFLWNNLRVSTEVIPHNDPDAPRPRELRYEQARVLGGGSSINGQLANRGSPADYEDWAVRGAIGWNWNSVLPYFRKIERDIDFDGPLHGSDGCIPVRRIFPDEWPDHAKACGEAFRLAGFSYLADQNATFEEGYFPLAISNLHERRVSSAIGYLPSSVRHRDNLTVVTKALMRELLFETTRCVGIRAQVAGHDTEFRGRGAVLCCGAIHSPAALLRAGIGPLAHLRELGIPMRAYVPGVGQRLMDHPSIAVASYINRLSRISPYTTHSPLVGLRFSSGLEGAPRGDMAVTVSTKSDWHAIGHRIAAMTIWVNKTYSETGQIRLMSPDWREEPRVDFNLLSDQRDLLRLMEAFRRIAAIHKMPPLSAIASDLFPTSFSDKIRKFRDTTLKNWILTALGGRLLDGPVALRHFMIRTFIADAKGIELVLADDEELEAFIRHAAIGVWHASCSCRMGSANDPMAVTNPSGVVRGVQALRVVDASIFPVIPCANTNFPTMMVAEKIADDILCAQN